MTMLISSLVGRTTFSGWDDCISTPEELKQKRYENGIAFILGDTCYEVYEDPVDGYRSTASGVRFSNTDRCRNRFEPLEVEIRECQGMEHEIVEFIYKPLGLVVAEIGTKNITDYYPCVSNYLYPTNLDMALKHQKESTTAYSTTITIPDGSGWSSF